MHTMRDVPKDLGQRILQAARLAAALHLRQVNQEQCQGTWLVDHESNFLIGRVGPSAARGKCSAAADVSKDGRLPDLGVRWAQGEIE